MTCRYSNSIWVMFFSPQSFLTKLDLKNFSLWPPKDVTKNHEILIKKFCYFETVKYKLEFELYTISRS